MPAINFRFKCGHVASLCYGSRKSAMKDKKKWRNEICAHCENEARIKQLKEQIAARSPQEGVIEVAHI